MLTGEQCDRGDTEGKEKSVLKKKAGTVSI